MNLNPEQIDRWLILPTEGQQLEFKEAKSQYDTSRLCKYCVAIANEGGGYLVLGVTDQKPRKVVGTLAFRDPQKIASKIYEFIGFRVNVTEVAHPDGRVLAFTIPPRPRGTAYSYEGAYLMRIGSELRPMSEDRLRSIFSEGKPGEKPDWLQQPAVSDVSAQDISRLLDIRAFFTLLNLSHPSDLTGVIDKLMAERLITGQGGRYTISNLAAVTLAKNLRDFENVARKAPRVVAYKGNNKIQTVKDIEGSKGYAVGFQGLVRYVMDNLPQNEVIEDALRKESKMLPEVSIRELVANALIHQDFEERGASPMIEIYADRVEISNPGEPIVPVERFIDGYQSRNEDLADIMRRFGICEEKSSGIDKVIQEVEDCQLPAPDFRADLKRTIVIIFGHCPFSKMNRTERIRACYQHCVWQYVLRQQMTNQSLRKRFGLFANNAPIVSQIIADAMKSKLIKPDPGASGSKKYARYLPVWA